MRHILRFDKSVLNKLRAAHYGLKRRLQLMRNIRRELAAHFFRFCLLGNIKRKQENSRKIFAGLDSAYVDLVFASVFLKVKRFIAACKCIHYPPVELRIAVNGQKIAADTRIIDLKKLSRSRIDSKHTAVNIQHYKCLVHAFGNLLQLIILSLKFPNLTLDFFMLNINPCQQGRYFGIRFVVLKRSVKIKLIQRSNNTFRHSVCQHGGQNNRNHRNKNHRLYHAEYKRRNGSAFR